MFETVIRQFIARLVLAGLLAAASLVGAAYFLLALINGA
jgi:hypothetical protein